MAKKKKVKKKTARKAAPKKKPARKKAPVKKVAKYSAAAKPATKSQITGTLADSHEVAKKTVTGILETLFDGRYRTVN